MKYCRQFLIILTISFLGEILKAVIPLPIPASIYGLLLMLTALVTGIVPVDSVRRTAEFLIEIMILGFLIAAIIAAVLYSTRMREKNQQLSEAANAKSDFLSNISHGSAERGGVRGRPEHRHDHGNQGSGRVLLRAM